MKPKISFFSTSYKQKEFLHGFFQNLISLEDWDKCELVMVRPKTFDKEENDIYDQYKDVKNFKIITINEDYGLYGCWNHAIKLCSADIITNANTDDRRLVDCIPNVLNNFKSNIDLLYADYYVADKKELIDYPTLCSTRSILPEFSIDGLIKYCLPGSAPFWRKKFCDKNDFRIDLMSAGDLHFWLNMYRNGASFKKLNELASVYFFNPTGQSTDKTKNKRKNYIENQIKTKFAQELFYSGEVFGKLEDIWVKL